MGIGAADWEPGIAALDWLERNLPVLAVRGLDPLDPDDAEAYNARAEEAWATVGRVNAGSLPAIRANLITYALRWLASNPQPAITATDARTLGNYLHIDLETDYCARTTRVQSAIEALQSFILVFQLGREDPLLPNALGSDFDARWRWLRSYETWYSAQTILLHPEHHLLPGMRPGLSQQFSTALDALATSADPGDVNAAVAAFRTSAAPLAQRVLYRHPLSTSLALDIRWFRTVQQQEYGGSQPGTTTATLLDEWYFWLPLAAAGALSEAGHYQEAVAWLHPVFFPFGGAFANAPGGGIPRLVWFGFDGPRDSGYAYRVSADWLRDPFSPFLIAATRAGAYVRHAVYQYVETLLAWADAEFTRDTSESVSRARELYELALSVLGGGDLPAEDECARLWRDVESRLLDASNDLDEVKAFRFFFEKLRRGRKTRAGDLRDLLDAILAPDSFEDRMVEVRELTESVLARSLPNKTLAALMQERDECELDELTAEDEFLGGWVEREFETINVGEVTVAEASARRVGCGFCVPLDTRASSLRWRAEASLEKIRTCRNFAGIRRQLSVTAEPRPAALGTGGPSAPIEPPPFYRFSFLIERARHFVSVAQQLEGQLLASFEKGDEARYSLMQARNDVRTADAAQRLRGLQLKAAVDQVELARLQSVKAGSQKIHYEALLNAGWSTFERHQVAYEKSAVDGYDVAAGFSWITAAMTLNLSLPFSANAASDAAMAQLYGTVAAYDRREQEWREARYQAVQDERIAIQARRIAQDGVAVADQEYAISRMEAEFATTGLTFLGEKFTGLELYEWMGRILSRYYRDHLNMATALALMAQRAARVRASADDRYRRPLLLEPREARPARSRAPAP